MTLERLVAVFDAKKVGSEWAALCPTHDDGTRSLFFKNGGDKILCTCRAGCDTEGVLAAKGLTLADLFVDPPKRQERKPVATYDYLDTSGNLLFQVVRFDPKDFRQRRPDGNGGWIWNLESVERVLYRLPELLSADPDDPVFIVEGEKDADLLISERLVATTNPGGAGKWRQEYNAELRGRKTYIILDNDEPGRKHAQEVASSLAAVAGSVAILDLPGLPRKGDVSDWLAAGHTTQELLQMAVLAQAQGNTEQPETPHDDVGSPLPPSDWLRPGDGLAARTVPTARIALTTLPTLHAATRDGLPTGSTTCILGGPDSAKTGLAMTIADAAEKQGFIVVHLTNDNGREAAEIRWGQMMGFDRTKLEEGGPDEVARFRAAFSQRHIFMPDPDLCDESLEPVNTLTLVIENARGLFSGSRVLLLVDSVQMVIPDDEKHESPRLRVIATMKLLRKAASVPGWLVVAPGQINREAFKNKNESKNTDPLTAGAESGAIEFGFDLSIFLSSKESGIWATITKNKPGAGRRVRNPFAILWDRDRALASEPDQASFAGEALKIAAQAREQLWEMLEGIVTADPGLATCRVQGKARGHREADVANALEAMAKASPPRLILKPKGNGKFWYPVELPAQGTL